MDVVFPYCCGLDVHKNSVVACVITPKEKEIRTFGTITRDLLNLADWIISKGCTHVAMESTGVFGSQSTISSNSISWNSWSSTPGILKPFQAAKPMSKMLNGSPTCCATAS